MELCYLIVRCGFLMGHALSDDALKSVDCYHETPVFYADSSREAVDIVDEAYERFCAGKDEFRCTESVELVRIL